MLYDPTPGDRPDDLDLVENLLAAHDAMGPAQLWDAEDGDLTFTDPYEYEQPEFDTGWDDPDSLGWVLASSVIDDARLAEPDGEGDDDLATVTALVPPQSRRHVRVTEVAA